MYIDNTTTPVVPVIKTKQYTSYSNYLFIVPAVLIFLVFLVYPIGWLFIQSLLGKNAVSEHVYVGFKNYIAVLLNPIFWKVIKNMALWALITIPAQMIIGGVIGYFIEFYTKRWKSFFRTMYFLPVVTSVSVVSIIWVQIYTPYYGIGQEFLKFFGIILNNSPIGNTRTVIYALILVNIWQWTGFSMLMYVAGFTNFPKDILESARIDGAKKLSLAIHIIIPLIFPITKSLLLLGIIGTLQTFPIVFLMTNGGPNHASEIFGTYIFKESFVLGNLGTGSSLSIIVLSIAFVLSIVQIFFLKSGFGAK